MKNESVKKSLEKSKRVLEEKRKKSSSKKFALKQEQHVFNNFYEFRSRAIRKQIFLLLLEQSPTQYLPETNKHSGQIAGK